MGACYLARCLLWKFMCCLEGSPTSMSLASRSAPVPLSPLAPYPCEARVRSERRARHENGARSERGTGTEREWEAPARGAWRGPRGTTQEGASGRHQLPTGAWRRPRGATQEGASTEGARQEGASTGGREHRRRKLRGVRVSELPKEPANNPQSLRVKPPKFRNSFSFAGPLAGYCNSFYDKCVDQPANDLQTTRKRKFRFAKCGKWSFFLLVLRR
jgi:hypothetical protein